MKDINNTTLKFELKKLKDFDNPIITKDTDEYLNYPYISGVNDNSYFYSIESERDSNF